METVHEELSTSTNQTFKFKSFRRVMGSTWSECFRGSYRVQQQKITKRERKKSFDEIEEHHSNQSELENEPSGSEFCQAITRLREMARRECGYITEIPEYMDSCLEDIESQIANDLEEIEKENEILNGLEQLSADENELSRSRESDEFCFSYENIDMTDLRKHGRRETRTTLMNPSVFRYSNYLQMKLKVTLNMRDRNVRSKKLGDVIFYYMMKGHRPNQYVQNIIHRLYDPRFDYKHRLNTYGWDELCCAVMVNDHLFDQIYTRLKKSHIALEYLLYKQPQLLFNKMSGDLVNTLTKHIPYDNLHMMLMNIKDERGQTHMFSTSRYEQFAELYMIHICDLYELLSMRNVNGQTALHVNTYNTTWLLASTYIPKHCEAFIELTSITDKNNRTALEFTKSQALLTLIKRVENNEYVTSSQYTTSILIIYNTNNRTGAEEEAKTIYNACKSVYDKDNIMLEKDKTKFGIIELIRQAATKTYWFGLPTTSLIVILMSHGKVGTINDWDAKPIQLSSIEEAMCSDALDGKPKTLITQCCQIGEESETNCPYVPTHDNFCAVMSCASGQGSERGVFIDRLSEKITNSRNDLNIFRIVSGVTKEMEDEEHEQTPIIMSTLRAEFCPTMEWSEPKQ